jgi:hypothetical protein
MKYKEMKYRMRNIALNSLILVVTTLFVLICAELVLRVFWSFTPRSGKMVPKARPKMLTPRTVIFEPNYTGKLVSREFDVSIKTNSLGFREREFEFVEVSSQHPYVFIGDSYFFGWGVNSDVRISERFLARLGAQGINASVVNLSFPGWGTYNYIDVLKAYATRLRPRLVILGFFVGNDFLDDLRVLNSHEETSADDQSVSSFYRAKIFIREICESSPILNLLRSVLWRSSLFRNIFNRAEIIQDRIYLYERNSSPLQDRLYHSTFTAFDELTKFSRANNIPILVVIIPDHIQVLTPGLFSHYDFNKPQRMLIEHLNKIQIPYIDLLNPFLSIDKPQNLFFSEDKHWDEQGHDFVAKILLEHILNLTSHESIRSSFLSSLK